MIRFTRSVAKIALLLSLVPGVVRASGGGGGKGFPGVGLSVSKETAPPGALTQVKISVTEPKPILTGGGSLSFSAFDSVFGIAIIAPGQDTFGVALERGTNVSLSVLSPSSSFGMNIDYPILTIAGRVPATAPIGAKFVLPIDAAAFQFLDSSGNAYPMEARAGQLTVNKGVAIGDVSPGSTVVPAGGIVTITGTNFVPNTNIRFAEAKISQVRYVSPTRIDVVLGQTATMHGMTVIAKNPDGTQDTYYSYQRTHAMSVSADPVMQYAVPLFPPKTAMTAMIPLPAPKAGVTYGVALQDIDSAGAYATIELVDAGGNAIAVTAANIDPSTFLVRELSELFGPLPPNGSAIRVTSSAPIQVMGIAADQNAGTADPIIAR
jgi:IPT/TIG domain